MNLLLSHNLKQEQEGQPISAQANPQTQPKGGEMSLDNSPQLYDNSLQQIKGEHGTFRL